MEARDFLGRHRLLRLRSHFAEPAAGRRGGGGRGGDGATLDLLGEGEGVTPGGRLDSRWGRVSDVSEWTGLTGGARGGGRGGETLARKDTREVRPRADIGGGEYVRRQGKEWWKRGQPASEALDHRLPSAVCGGGQFAWGGALHARARP